MAGRLIASHPRLIPHTVSTAVKGAATAVKADPTLGVGWRRPRRNTGSHQAQSLEPTGAGSRRSSRRSENMSARIRLPLKSARGRDRVTRRLQPLVAELHTTDVSPVILDEGRAFAPQVRCFTVTGFGDSLPDGPLRPRWQAIDVFVHFEFDELRGTCSTSPYPPSPRACFVVSVYTLDSDAEREVYRSEISNSPRLPARRTRRFPSETYEKLSMAIFGFEVIDQSPGWKPPSTLSPLACDPGGWRDTSPQLRGPQGLTDWPQLCPLRGRWAHCTAKRRERAPRLRLATVGPYAP